MLGAFGALLQALERERVPGNIYALLFFVFRGDIFINALIEVIAAEMRVSAGSLYLHGVIPYFQNRNVKSSATEIVNHYLLVLFFVESVSQGCRRGLVQDAPYLQAGNLSGI